MKYVIIALVAVGGLAVLAWSMVSVETEIEGPEGHVSNYEENPPSLDQQIFDSDIIVKATFVSATPASEERNPRWAGRIHIPVQYLRFRSQEYLKGTGPTEFVVEIRTPEANDYYGYPTSEEAIAAARTLIAERDTTYDNREAILFLNGPLTAVGDPGGSDRGRSSDGSTTTYGFPETYMDRASWDYSVSSGQKLWMPANNAGGSGDSDSSRLAPDTSQTEFIVDSSTDPVTLVSLADFKAKIAAMTKRLSDNAHIEGYERCVGYELRRERALRGKERLTLSYDIPSAGDPALNVISSLRVKYGDTAYRSYATSGADAEYFQGLAVDDDEDPAQYLQVKRPSRPLPEGNYEVSFRIQAPHYIPCNLFPDDFPLSIVTVTAPAGTLHEAFFDPVAVGTSVKADSTNGVLSPTSFTVGGTATEITSLEWANNKVVLTLDPHVSLGNNVLHFIELDGSVPLSFSAADATVDSTAGTHSWPVTTEPWEAGDKLMLRIREGQ